MKKGIQNFSPTPEMVSAAETVFNCMAAVETIRPIVTGYQKKVLAMHQFTNLGEKEMLEKVGRPFQERVILNPNHDYLLRDEDFQIYLSECNIEMAKAGFKIERDGDCPLLVAEELLRKAQRNLVGLMEPITFITADDVLCTKDGVKNYNQLISLTLSLLAPFASPKPFIS